MQTLEELQGGTQPFIAALPKILPQGNCRIFGVVFTASEPGGITDGFIWWNNELLPFKGGELHSRFSIMEETITRNFNVGTPADPELEDYPAYIKRWAEVGNISGAESVNYFTELAPAPKLLSHLHKGDVYIGSVVPTIDLAGIKIDVAFPNVGTSNYIVLGSFTAGANVSASISYLIKSATPTGFKLHLTNIFTPVDYVFFRYVLIPQ